ncbi:MULTISPECIES: AmmeMemoRadiSam system protein A [unclassified Acidaminococcus]|uniref:AmmeMemoRadiSam system protein A n=1 Tax=unclassified Acidaminococcus TaxID=2635771 RepID=UPI0003356233|nr:AmmeMemoRadiSam system protein A [Acidaminococcus sp. CAG:542]CDE93824.1 aMMECR1 domain protein [Acidaminococcus sp. CAG:542]
MTILASFAVPHPPIILPEVGRGEERKIAATTAAYEAVMKQAAELHSDTLIITSPHAEMYLDYFHMAPGRKAQGNFAQFRAPQVEISAAYDQELASLIADEAEKAGIPAGFEGERNPDLDHGTMIPLYFYRKYGSLDQVKVVRIGLSGFGPDVHYLFGRCIRDAADKLGRRAVFIASGDLSHKLKEDGPYGYVPEGPVFDRQCTEALGQGDFFRLLTLDHSLCTRAAECGLRSFWIMAGAWDGRDVASRLLSYEGPFGVGYGVASFLPQGPDPARQFLPPLLQAEKQQREDRIAREDPYVKLARLSVETWVKHREMASLPAHLPPEMLQTRAGAFVSLHLHDQLRGCIGTFLPTQANVAEEILRNGISAASRDPRFPPVRPEELPFLEYNVDVLSTPEPVSGPEGLDPRKYGVIVKSARDERRGLLLPDLDGVDTTEEQIAIARQKGNIAATEPVQLYRFQVVRHR